MKRIYLLSFAIIFCSVLRGQMPKIPPMRQLHHEYIQESLHQIENRVPPSDSIASEAYHAVDKLVTEIRISIEKNSALDDNTKFSWLRSVNEMLTGFLTAAHAGLLDFGQLLPLAKAYDQAMKTQLRQLSLYDVFEKNDPEICNILAENYTLKSNFDSSRIRNRMLFKYAKLHPDRTLELLSQHPENVFADSLIVMAAFRDPEKLYNYAAAPNALGRKILSNNHPLVALIGQLSLTKTGRMYFPFLDQIYHNRIKLDSITPLLTEERGEDYFKLLVTTRIAYHERMQLGDTPLLVHVLTAKLKSKSIELYVNDINALHDEKNLNIRFKKLERLSAQELYYLAVMGESELYTSSFVTGIYPTMIQRMKQANTDALLVSVGNDYFKKFIKMAAIYNTLDDFLKRMDSSAATNRMRYFVNGLEQTKTLEEAVDVADSYSSIYQPTLKDLILQQVQRNLLRTAAEQDARGQTIYELLNAIFLSMDTANHIDLTTKLGIEPVYQLRNQNLRDANGNIILQQFFYGDKDGMTIFNAFLAGFQNGKWNVRYKPEWVEVSAKSGVPVTIYANRPLDAGAELDEQAQRDLSQELSEKGLMPSIVVHRGHSYHLSSTIKKIKPSAKLVILGSCGGFQNLNDVLQICPATQIISTKQLGAGVINKLLVNEICERLRAGKDLNWPELWKSMSRSLQLNGAKNGVKESFNDYVPPHQNLGAIFIMAYQNAMLQRQTKSPGIN